MDEPEYKLGPPPPSMAWLLTFADLISLLLTFFILLYSMKVINAQKWESLRGAFDNTFSVKEEVVETKPDKTDTIEKIDAIRADNLDYLATILKTRFSKDPVLSATKIDRNPELDTITLNLPSKFLFDAGSANMKKKGKQTMANLGDLLRHVDNKIEVAGHTDPNPINTAQYPTNWELSAARALEVALSLKRQGIESRIPAVAYADSRFYQVDKSKPVLERYQIARRVEIIIHGNQ